MKPAFDRSALPYWDARAQRWKVSQPISPGPEDQRFYEACAARRAPDDGGELSALLLGVTPAIAQMRWPGPTRLVALDWSGGMFRNVWPREHLPGGAAGVRGDWRAMPLADGSVDFAIGDGCYSTFRDLEGPALLNREVHRVLRPGGEFCLRCHRRPDVPHSVERLFEWLHAGRFQNLDLFRWILAMAVHGDSTDGVSLHRVWETWREQVPDAKALAARFGWTHDAVANMNAWEKLESRYFFPTLDEINALARPYFELELCDLPGYEWGEQFPRLLMRRVG
jgi:SAM-dependent methyltransferase